jgi:hypothetical protein
MNQYNRHAIAPLDAIIPEIMAQWDTPKAKMEYGGFEFNIYSLRLKTFCRSAYKDALHCTACGLRASYFAIESFKRGNQKSYHVNLYGMVDGKEILFTHDHTLARSLGGADSLSNTTVMCSPCNSKKGQEEAREVSTRRFMAGLGQGGAAFQHKLMLAKKNPTNPRTLEKTLNEWAAKMSADNFTKRVDTWLMQFGWKRKQLKQMMNEGVINFNLHPVRD